MGALDLSFTAKAKYSRAEGRVLLTGIEALVRLPMMQRRLDRSRGLSTAGLISGYRGSPLGAYDQQLWKSAKELAEHDIVFQPGLNEDLAATALWGAQMHRAFGPTRVDGVFGIWYGKGPGVDRSGDVLRTANILGTSRLGGVVAVSGDDHAAQSSMYPHQTDGIFQSASIPVLQPASVRDILDLGLAAFELSRFSGLWISLKTIAEVIETAASFDLPLVTGYQQPADFSFPEHGLGWDPLVQWPGQRAELERRLIEERLPAARAWARANSLDRLVIAAPQRRLGIITVGKAHQDFMQGMADLGISTKDAQALGVSVYKVAMSWPLETERAIAFAKGHDEILVIEEKRSVVEAQLKEALYHHPVVYRPRVTGKTDEVGRALLPETLEFNARLVARTLIARMSVSGIKCDAFAKRLAAFDALAPPKPGQVVPIRKPYFCAGCPHNSSTPTPEGSVTGGGIGCHVMALQQPWLRTHTFSQMGGEGAQWMGAAPFSQTKHTFQNLGDGTYQHSGILAIRAAVAAKTNITFKILYNDAVAMTGGQPAEGVIDPARITRQLHAEGVARIALVSDQPQRWRGAKILAPGVTVHYRDEMDTLQRAYREIPGVTAIVYEQTCAAEKRRRRKRGSLAESPRRLFINERVCEGCGDCSVQSNCIAVEPLRTDYGRKRRINQSACNTDLSCIKGFCPSFVEIADAELRKPDNTRLSHLEAELAAKLPTPSIPSISQPFNVYVTGIGGTGVLTLGALIGAAAHLEGKGTTVLDFTGLAQKNGAVVSQIRIATSPDDIYAARISSGSVDLLLAADLVVSAGQESQAKLSPDRTVGVINLGDSPTADFVRDRDATLPAPFLRELLEARCRRGKLQFVDASEATRRLFGDTLSTHVLMLGHAWQAGLVPISQEAIDRALELNGAAVAQNRRAFKWGRILCAHPEAFARLDPECSDDARSPPFDALIERYAQDLAEYQNASYSRRYVELVERARIAERSVQCRDHAFSSAVAVSAYRLMAYKDEYEVARLYSSRDFRTSLQRQFSATGRLSVWLAPPILSRLDAGTGRPRKRKYGPWMLRALRLLAALRGLRGTALDPFGYTADRRAERRLITEFFADIEALCSSVSATTLDQAIEFARIPQEIRGFGPVKLAAIEKHVERRKVLLRSLSSPIAKNIE